MIDAKGALKRTLRLLAWFYTIYIIMNAAKKWDGAIYHKFK
jgi:hypothetical protein